MKKTKQVLAIVGIVLLAGMYVSAFVLAFQKSPQAQFFFRLAIGATILVPVLLYLILMVARMVRPQKSAVVDSLVFDLGKVLVDWPWEECAAEMGISEEAVAAIRDRVVLTPLWREFDRSRKEDDEIIRDVLAQIPEYEAEFRKILPVMHECCEPFWYTESWLRALKRKGYKLYYLSNWGRTGHDAAVARGAMDFTKLMDGGIWSYEYQEVKPEPQIYQRLIRKYHLNPGRTIFIDDNKENVDAAKREGMGGIVFTDINDAAEKLAAVGVRWQA